MIPRWENRDTFLRLRGFRRYYTDEGIDIPDDEEEVVLMSEQPLKTGDMRRLFDG